MTPLSLNLYTYCYNNPILYFDPTGHITQAEQKMYQEGKMAPAAYSYLMNLTYQWYLADTNKEKEILKKWADDFRAANYLTTNGLFTEIDDAIREMPSKPSEGGISQKQHYFRNKLNLDFTWGEFQKLNERLPDWLKWRKLEIDKSLFHMFKFEWFNEKYVSACEHFELVFDKDHSLQTELNNTVNMGTYNYYGPKDAEKHTTYDVLPWLKWGNVIDAILHPANAQ